MDEARPDPLLDRVRGGDPAALAELFSRHKPLLRRMIELRLDPRLNGRVSPSDILQEAWLDALRRIQHFAARPEMPFLVWLRLIAVQRMIDVHRQHLGAAMRNAGKEAPPPSTAMLAAHVAGGLTSPSQAAIRRETLERLEDALERMDATDREVLALRHFEELSNHETAAALGIQPAAASKRYVRALSLLREALSVLPGFWEEEEESPS
jgi:RNA polymerase sigma-70 factor (ECF subfamily)